MLTWQCVFIAFEFASLLMPSISWWVSPGHVSIGFFSVPIKFSSQECEVIWRRFSGSCCASVFPRAWELCLQNCDFLLAMLWAMYVLLLQLEQHELWITCSLSCAVVSLLWMAMTLLFFHVTSCSGSMSSLQRSWDTLLQVGPSVFCVPHLQTHLEPPLAIKAAMHEAADSPTAPIPYQIYPKKRDWSFFPAFQLNAQRECVLFSVERLMLC